MTRQKPSRICRECGSDTRFQNHRVSCRRALKCPSCGKPAMAPGRLCAPCDRKAQKDADHRRRQEVIAAKLRKFDDG